MKDQACIILKKASLGYKGSGQEFRVLKDLELEFFPGDFIGLVGLNGTGKSTLLKSISSLLQVLDGEIFVEGNPLSKLPHEELAKKAAIVLTEKIGGFNLTVFDTVAAGQMPYTNSFHQLREENLNLIRSAIATCGLQGYENKPLNELSDGLFQKTVIAKALAQQTPVMLLDEPSAFLDYASKHELFLLLKHLVEKESKCILLSSHDLGLILKYCNKLLIIADGSAELVPVSHAMQNNSFLKIGGGFL